MSKEFRKLLCLDASEIEVGKIENKNLQGILGKVIEVNEGGDFIFRYNHKGKHHKDHSDYSHSDYDYDGVSYSDSEGHGSHTDHADHTDHKDRSHVDRSYSEGRYHTDSEGGAF